MKMTLRQMLATAVVLNIAAIISFWMINPWLLVPFILARFGAFFGARFVALFMREWNAEAKKEDGKP